MHNFQDNSMFASDMRPHAKSTKPNFGVGDQVIVVKKGSRYKGLFGIVVRGHSGTGFTDSYLSVYVHFEEDKSAFRTLRCASLAFVNHIHRSIDRSGETSLPSSFSSCDNPSTDNFYDRLKELCTELESLAIQGEMDANTLIITFAQEIIKKSKINE